MSDVQGYIAKGKQKNGEECVWHVTNFLRSGNNIGYM